MKKRGYRRTHEQNQLRYRNLCEHCLVWFDTSRPDARFCGAKCRYEANREKKRQGEQARTLAMKHITEASPVVQKVGKRKPSRPRPGGGEILK